MTYRRVRERNYSKAEHEFAYWRGRKRAEGDLRGRAAHYEEFFTAQFGHPSHHRIYPSWKAPPPRPCRE